MQHEIQHGIFSPIIVVFRTNVPLNNNLMSRPQWIKDSTGKITGYTTQEGGAGTVFPFSRDAELVHSSNWVYANSYNYTYNVDKDGEYVIFMSYNVVDNTYNVNLNVSNADVLFNSKSSSRGACAVYTAKRKKGESIVLSYNVSYQGGKSFACFILRV